MSANNIEAGCLAMIISGEDSGKCVNVIKYEGDSVEEGLFAIKSKRLWKIDLEIGWTNEHALLSLKFPYIPESALMRIDDPDLEEESETEEELDLVS